MATAKAKDAPAFAVGGEDNQHADPWFTPESQPAAGRDVDVGRGADGAQAEWFLPTGRAGLLPESMTVSGDGDEHWTDQTARGAAAGAPPWAGEAAALAAGEPPPWENGPWPGPGQREGDQPTAAPAGDEPAEPSWTAPHAAAPRLPRRRLLAAGAAVAVLVVAVVVIVTSTSGGSGGGCTSYPAAVRHAYLTAMSDLSSRAPAAVLAADLAHGASLANASAASAGQISVRTALFAMASDLDEAHSDVVAHRPVSPALLQRLTADGTAPSASCAG